ncbi:hypothetical protein VTJ83DRAFT_3086 [Remersonia thermophila]|uniref:NB-ARC domain-containing protein n=1 Tax=Remersonia thermophila TaxID=72144 RepID=A0ABR4DD49_9PEZI
MASHQNNFGHCTQGNQIAENYGTINNHFLSQSPPLQPAAFIPFSRDGDFVNRGDTLDKISRLLSRPRLHNRVALVGLGGVGKSQIAIEYAHSLHAAEETKPNRKWIFWIHASTKDRVEQSLKDIANHVRLPDRENPDADIPQLVKGWLCNPHNGQWFIVIDSADDDDIFLNKPSDDRKLLEQYLPQSHHGSILITTRSEVLASGLTGYRGNIIHVGPMTQGEALTLLQNRLTLEPPLDIDTASKLVDTLGFIPLAISQAAAYIQKRGLFYSAQQYLADFPRKRSKLLEYDGGDLRRDPSASNAILTTWQITFDYLRSKRPSAADLLSLISFFDPQGIPLWVLKPSTYTRDASTRTQPSADVSDVDSADDDIDDEFNTDAEMLKDYCLVSANRNGKDVELTIHPLVKYSTHWWLKAHDDYERFHLQFVARMAVVFPDGEYNNWPICQSLFPHIQAALEYKPNDGTVEVWGRLLSRAGRYMLEQGRYELAHQILSKAKAELEVILGAEHELNIDITARVAIVLKEQGRLDKAEELQVQALTKRQERLGLDHPDTLVSMNNLAFLRKAQGRLDDAIELMNDVAEREQKVLGADHPSTQASLSALVEWRNQRIGSQRRSGFRMWFVRR